MQFLITDFFNFLHKNPTTGSQILLPPRKQYQLKVGKVVDHRFTQFDCLKGGLNILLSEPVQLFVRILEDEGRYFGDGVGVWLFVALYVVLPLLFLLEGLVQLVLSFQNPVLPGPHLLLLKSQPLLLLLSFPSSLLFQGHLSLQLHRLLFFKPGPLLLLQFGLLSLFFLLTFLALFRWHFIYNHYVTLFMLSCAAGAGRAGWAAGLCRGLAAAV